MLVKHSFMKAIGLKQIGKEMDENKSEAEIKITKTGVKNSEVR